jgi:hypothetical protein
MSSEDESLLLQEPAEVKEEESGLAGVEQVEDSRFIGNKASPTTTTEGNFFY